MATESTMADSAAFPPLHGVALVAATAVCATANFMVPLDISIANVSIPTIAAGLGASPNEGSWVITSYAVAEAITVPLTGWLAQRFGAGRTFTVAVAGFGIASALCGLSPSLGMLVACRVLQGLAGGPMVPLSQTLLLSVFPKEKANFAMGLWATTAVMGPSFGPVLGGYICDHWSWSWIFLLNLPIALLGTFFSWRIFSPRDTGPRHRPVDMIGFCLMMISVGAVQTVLDRGQDLDWLGSSFIVGMIVIAIISTVAFLIWELTERNPIVNLRVFRHRSYSTIVAVTCLSFGAFMGQGLLLTLWLQTNLGYTPGVAGTVMAPGPIAMFCVSPFVVWLSSRFDLRLLVSFGLGAMAFLFLWEASLPPDVTYATIVTQQIVGGMCLAFFFGPAMSLCLNTVDPSELNDAAGLFHFGRTICMAFGVSLSITYWQNAATQHRVAITDRFGGPDALHHMTNAGIAPGQALGMVDGMVQSQAIMQATLDSFSAFAMLMALCALGVWLVPRIKPSTAVAAH